MSLNASKLTKVMTASGNVSSVRRGGTGPAVAFLARTVDCRREHFQAEDLADVHWEGESSGPALWGLMVKAPSLSHTSFVASTTSISILLSGTSPPMAQQPNARGKENCLSSAFPCNPWRTILYWTCIQDTEHFFLCWEGMTQLSIVVWPKFTDKYSDADSPLHLVLVLWPAFSRRHDVSQGRYLRP